MNDGDAVEEGVGDSVEPRGVGHLHRSSLVGAGESAAATVAVGRSVRPAAGGYLPAGFEVLGAQGRREGGAGVQGVEGSCGRRSAVDSLHSERECRVLGVDCVRGEEFEIWLPASVSFIFLLLTSFFMSIEIIVLVILKFEIIVF